MLEPTPPLAPMLELDKSDLPTLRKCYLQCRIATGEGNFFVRLMARMFTSFFKETIERVERR